MAKNPFRSCVGGHVGCAVLGASGFAVLLGCGGPSEFNVSFPARETVTIAVKKDVQGVPLESEEEQPDPIADRNPRESDADGPIQSFSHVPEGDGLDDLHEKIRLPKYKALHKTFIPKVMLSGEHASTCLKNVGDSLADISLTDTQDNGVSLQAQLADRLTVVVFADPAQPMSREQVARLDEEVTQPFGRAGVAAVVVAVGIEPGTRDIPSFEGSLLFDRDRSACQQLATDLLPRTYVLDPHGRILWFDLEYSRDMRWELQNAILYFLKEQKLQNLRVGGA